MLNLVVFSIFLVRPDTSLTVVREITRIKSVWKHDFTIEREWAKGILEFVISMEQSHIYLNLDRNNV